MSREQSSTIEKPFGDSPPWLGSYKAVSDSQYGTFLLRRFGPAVVGCFAAVATCFILRLRGDALFPLTFIVHPVIQLAQSRRDNHLFPKLNRPHARLSGWASLKADKMGKRAVEVRVDDTLHGQKFVYATYLQGDTILLSERMLKQFSDAMVEFVIVEKLADQPKGPIRFRAVWSFVGMYCLGLYIATLFFAINHDRGTLALELGLPLIALSVGFLIWNRFKMGRNAKAPTSEQRALSITRDLASALAVIDAYESIESFPDPKGWRNPSFDERRRRLGETASKFALS